MLSIRVIAAAALLAGTTMVANADDILDAIGVAQKSYHAGDLTSAKQSLDLASQLIGQKNAEGYAALLPAPFPGWTAQRAETTSLGGPVMLGASIASRNYSNGKGENVEVQITGDSAMIVQMAAVMSNPQIAGAMGKLVKVGSQRAIQTSDGDVHMVIANKFLVTVQGTGTVADKLAYAQAIDVLKLTKM